TWLSIMLRGVRPVIRARLRAHSQPVRVLPRCQISRSSFLYCVCLGCEGWGAPVRDRREAGKKMIGRLGQQQVLARGIEAEVREHVGLEGLGTIVLRIT